MKTIYTVAALLLLSQSATPRAVAAQFILTPGARVRLTGPAFDSSTAIGTVVRTVGDSLMFRDETALSGRTLAIRDLRSIEVSNGMRRHVARDAGYGLLIGAVSGAILGAATHKKDSGWFQTTAGFDAAFVGTAFGTIGMVVGGLIGVSDKSERWIRAR
jgi:hypothetical protein